MKPPVVFFLLVGLFICCGSRTIHAQAGPEKGGRELEIWTSGGHGVKGAASDIGVWTAGGRYGWILTGPRGPGLLRGNLEYVRERGALFLFFFRRCGRAGVAI